MSNFNLDTSKYPIQILSIAGEKLYLNEDFADFHFIFKSKSVNGRCEYVPAHRMLLGISSDVFRVMFNGSWKEKTNVEIVDASAGAFKEFLQFFYRGKVKLTMENVAVVMNLGKMYDVAECFKTCGKFLRNNLTDEEICWAYELAIHLEHSGVIKYCETVIGLNTKEIFASEGFLKSDQKVVSRILKLDFLTCTETEAFEALLNWIKAAVNQNDLTKEIVRGRFDDLFHEIRFGSMTLEEFLSLNSNADLFSYIEYRDNIQTIALKDHQSNPFKMNARTRIENIKWGKGVSCNRLLSNKYSCAPYFIKDIETTIFSTNEPLLLKKFTFSKLLAHFDGNFKTLKELPSEITIAQVSNKMYSQNDHEIIFHQEKVNLQSEKSTSVTLTKPILIRPGFMYEIRMKQLPSDKCCTTSLMNTEVLIGTDIIIEFHNDPFLDGDKAARGTIHNLEFKRI